MTHASLLTRADSCLTRVFILIMSRNRLGVGIACWRGIVVIIKVIIIVITLVIIIIAIIMGGHY